MRYLLDELMAYEEGFTDIMMDNRASEQHETFMGMKDPSSGLSTGDLALLQRNLPGQACDLLMPLLKQPGARTIPFDII